jgi:hypothetical protein
VSGRAARTPAAARCPSKARLGLAAAGLLAGVDRGLVWPRLRCRGATDDELAGPFPGADRIHSEWPQVVVGDRWLSTPSGRSWFEVAALDPERSLGLRAPLRLDGRPFDLAGPRPRLYSDSSWGFALSELPGHRTRLLVSGYAASHPRALTAIGDLLFWEPAHWIMRLRQLANLKAHAEHEQQSAGDVPEQADDMTPAEVG